MLTYEIQRVRADRSRGGRGAAKPSRVYVWLPETILENLQNRRSRNIKEMRRHAEAGVEQYKASRPSEGGGTRMDSLVYRWSQKAGCSCGCSPGFILYRCLWAEDTGYYDIHVTVKDSEAEEAKQQQAANEAMYSR